MKKTTKLMTAAIALADEFVKSIDCPEECTLPERITSVSRQGVNYQVFDAQDFLTKPLSPAEVQSLNF